MLQSILLHCMLCTAAALHEWKSFPVFQVEAFSSFIRNYSIREVCLMGNMWWGEEFKTGEGKWKK